MLSAPVGRFRRPSRPGPRASSSGTRAVGAVVVPGVVAAASLPGELVVQDGRDHEGHSQDAKPVLLQYALPG